MVYTNDITADYLMVKNIGMALAALAFVVAVATAAGTDAPHTQMRAKSLIVQSLIAFVLLAGDRMLARGIATWFGADLTHLPPFWQ